MRERCTNALLLAAGLGSRLRPLTDHLPKCLAPIDGRPLLELWLRCLQRAGFSSVIVNTHHLSTLVDRYVTGSAYRELAILSPESDLLGTAGTMLKHRALWESGPILVAHADNLTVFDPVAFVAAHYGRPSSCVMTMMTFDSPDPTSCGIVELDAAGVVVGFHEKPSSPPGTLANAAVYVVESEVIDYIESLGTGPIDFSTQVIPAFIGRIFTAHNSGQHRDVGTLQSWRQAQREFKAPPPEEGYDIWEEMLGERDRYLARAIQRLLDPSIK